MRRLAICAVGISAIAAPTPALAAAPQALVEAAYDTDMIWFVDTETIRRDADAASAWVFVAPAHPLSSGSKPTIAAAVWTVEDCKLRTFRNAATVNYSEDGPGPVEADPGEAKAAPDRTVSASILDFICSGKPPTERVFPTWRLALDFARRYFEQNPPEGTSR